MKTFILVITVLLLVSCKKNNEILPGDAQYCVECEHKYDTCASLNAIDKWKLKNNYTNCYYTNKP